ncbi:hypothetical protein [Shewanella sp. T24-MNA-CIBAN-0130]|uniref:hypothetical protein n=1 Tax=Shewanella sp. T24-MNA-CIBAN-0130 TaxID=3140470 RepID=UPI00332F5C32
MTHINAIQTPPQVKLTRSIKRNISTGKETENFLRTQEALSRIAAAELLPERRNTHGDIIYGTGRTAAHKDGWSLIGNRFTTNKLEAIEHAKRLDRMLRG